MSDAACPVGEINVLALFKEELHALGQELAEFSPSEQECISKNIAAKIKEGWERNQAIAASINICAPGKSKSKSQEREPSEDKSVFAGGERMDWEVWVSNIGKVYTGDDGQKARQIYDTYVQKSKTRGGRADGEDVTLAHDDEIVKEYTGRESRDLEKRDSREMSQVQSGAVETPGMERKEQFAEYDKEWQNDPNNYVAYAQLSKSEYDYYSKFLNQAGIKTEYSHGFMHVQRAQAQKVSDLLHGKWLKKKFVETPTRLPGGDYTAVQNKDGTWNILNVPIFAEVAKGDRGNNATIGKEWMEKAVVRGQARFKARKYLAPLHVHHHDGGTKTSRAGFILPTRVEMVLHPDKPEKVPAIISDLLFVPNEAFQEIEAGRLPYRSVEVADWSRPEIASLALLPDEVPFFKFPLLTIGRKLKASTPVKFSVKSCPALASRAAGQGAFILFRFSGGSVMAKKFTDGEDRPEKKNPDAAPPWAHEMMEALKAIHKHLTETPKEKDGEKMAEDDEESKKAELELAAEPEKEEKLDALDDTPKDSYADEHTPVEQDAPKGKSKEKQEGSGYSQDVAVKLTAVTAEVAKLRAIENGRRKSAEVEGIVAGAKKDLAEHNMTEEGEVLLRDMVKHEGKAGAAKFVATWKKSVPKDPPQTAGEYFDGQGEASEFPEEVMKFAGRGPDVLAKAKQLFGDYQKLNGKCGTKVDRFIELNLI